MIINPITIKVSRDYLEALIEAAEAHREALVSRSLGSTRKAQENRENADILYNVLMHIDDAIVDATRKNLSLQIEYLRPVS